MAGANCFHQEVSLLVQQFVRSRPYLFHLTDASNLPHIKQSGVLVSAAVLFRESNRTDLLTIRRRQHHEVVVNGVILRGRDQAPLHKGNLALPVGYAFESFVASLNERVFFWPGTASGPIGYGL